MGNEDAPRAFHVNENNSCLSLFDYTLCIFLVNCDFRDLTDLGEEDAEITWTFSGQHLFAQPRNTLGLFLLAAGHG
jgi:hypothetical protein